MDEKDTRKLLGENIRRIRWSKNMTQEAFSEKIGIEPSSLSNIENGKSLPSTQTILNIQQQFDVSPNDIFDFDIDYVKSAQNLEEEIVNLKNTKFSPNKENREILNRFNENLEVGQSAYQLLKRPNIDYKVLYNLGYVPSTINVEDKYFIKEVLEQAEILIKNKNKQTTTSTKENKMKPTN